MPRTTIASRARAATAETFRRGQRRCGLSLESLERRDCPAVVAVIGSGTITEGGESLLLTVRLSAPDTKAVRVGYVISGDGSTPSVVPADYRLSVGNAGLPGPSGNIEFRPGETVKQVRIAAVDDAAREGTESLRFTLFRPVGCTIDAARAKVDVTVRDNDDYTASLVPQGASRITEGSAAPFVIELTSPATKAETFFVTTQDGTATTRDYRPLREMPVTILAGQRRSQPFALNTVADADPTETDEYFLVNARPRSADLPPVDTIGVTTARTGPGPITLAVSSPSVVEGNVGFTACTFTVTLSAPALDPIVVQYATADGTASAGVDYVAAAGSLTFTRGQISKTVTVNVIGDTNVEDAETFQFVASTTAGGLVSSAAGVATIRDDDTAFEITLKFVDTQFGRVPEGVRQLAREAAARWSRVIVGDLPPVPLAGGGEIDDFELTVQMGLLGDPDGTAPGTLANATPTAYRTGLGGLPYAGITGLDPADVLNISTPVMRQWVLDIITHEIGHTLGFASSNTGFQRWIQGTNWVGQNAVREYSALSGSTQSSVPLETGGGAGTAGAHWAEDLFRDELMTGYVAAQGVRMPLSRLTVGALHDLGYTVNYAAADPYALSRSSAVVRQNSRTANVAVALSMALDQQRAKPVLRAAAFAAIA